MLDIYALHSNLVRCADTRQRTFSYTHTPDNDVDSLYMKSIVHMVANQLGWGYTMRKDGDTMLVSFFRDF